MVKLSHEVPDGTVVEIVVPENAHFESEQNVGSFVESLGSLVGSVEGPEDWAKEHDHYIHGLPKKGNVGVGEE